MLSRMIRSVRQVLFFCTFFWMLARCATVPSGTLVEVRLLTPINSAEAKPQQLFEAVVIAPVSLDGAIVVAQGVKLLGHISEVTVPRTLSEQTVLVLSFDRLRDGARAVPFSGRLVEVENSRETVDKDGRLLGIKASDTGSARLDQGIKKVSQKYAGLGELLGVVKQSMMKEADGSINYPAGVDMRIEVTKALGWTGVTPQRAVAAIEPEDALIRLVQDQPVMTYAVKPAKASDEPNLLLLGTEVELTAAMEAAGWSQAGQLSRQSKFEVFRALAEDRGFKEAPVSMILLEGRPPDLVFEKLNNTFAARHHLRLWRRPGTLRGQLVWVGAATHDTGISFSEENHTFIHTIDSHLDAERAKVVNDLLFTGLVKGLSLVDRPDAPTSGRNATGDPFVTDGRMAVLQF